MPHTPVQVTHSPLDDTMRLLIPVGLFATLSACFFDEPCQRYADYMCDCHTETAEECRQFQAIAETADPRLQDQCEIDLAEQQQEDAINGFVCGEGPVDTFPQSPVGETGDTGA